MLDPYDDHGKYAAEEYLYDVDHDRRVRIAEIVALVVGLVAVGIFCYVAAFHMEPETCEPPSATTGIPTECRP